MEGLLEVLEEAKLLKYPPPSCVYGKNVIIILYNMYILILIKINKYIYI